MCEIGQRIKELLDRRGISVNDFAKQLDMSDVALYKVLKKNHINTELLVKISNLLDTRISYFFIPELSNLEVVAEPRVYYETKPHIKQYQNNEDPDVQRLLEKIKLLEEFIKLKDEQLALYTTKDSNCLIKLFIISICKSLVSAFNILTKSSSAILEFL